MAVHIPRLAFTELLAVKCSFLSLRKAPECKCFSRERSLNKDFPCGEGQAAICHVRVIRMLGGAIKEH